MLSVFLIGASSSLAQTPPPGGPFPWPHPPTNSAPVVEIVTPHDGSMLLSPAAIHICAIAAYFTDAVANVEFFANANSLGVVTNSPIGLGGREDWRLPQAYFCLTWTNVPPGPYSLSAVATDLGGNMVTSTVVDITVVTNFPPHVTITKPHNGAMILGPTNVNVCATAFDPEGGTVTQVEFFEGGTSLGVVTNIPTIYITNRFGVFPVKNTSYCVTWTNVPPGAYTLTAVATDNDGAMTTSDSVDISVVTNLPPRVRIVSPYARAAYFAPATVSICAAASDPDGTVASVEFFEGSNSLGVVTSGTVVTNREGIYELFCFTWNAVPAGSYTLTAVATDNYGATSTSAAVPITVVTPPPPSVQITTPRNGETFFAPANIWICSLPRHFPDPVASVEYFSGATSLGIVTNGPGYCFRWMNVPPGAYSLTATAKDVAGTNIVTSAAVQITVTTNRPPHWGR